MEILEKLAKIKARERSWNNEGYHEGRKVADTLNLKANAVKEGMPNQQLP